MRSYLTASRGCGRCSAAREVSRQAVLPPPERGFVDAIRLAHQLCPNASRSPASNAAAAWSHAEEGAGSGKRPNLPRAQLERGRRARRRRDGCVAAQAERGGEFRAAAIGHSRLVSATTEMTGVAGSQAPVASTAASITRVCVATTTFGTSRCRNRAESACTSTVGRIELAARDRRRDFTPATAARIDETRRDHLCAVRPPRRARRSRRTRRGSRPPPKRCRPRIGRP